MALPINIKELLRGRIIESNRIECKKDWNPEKVMKTITAFSNDIDEVGGGYIILGATDEEGSIEVTGLDPKSIDRIQKELLNVCNLIKPRYIPYTEVYSENNATILIIWAYSGEDRPYSCPNHIGKNNETGRSCYIRKMASTIQADREYEIKLYEMGKHTAFDERPNLETSLDDLSTALMTDYLKSVGSELYKIKDTLSKDELAESMHIIGGPKEARTPINVGLLFFNYNPEQFFNYTRIEVVDKPDPTGQGMTEMTFTGPLDHQLMNALQFIRSYSIRERIYKLDDQAEAVRFFNYPYAALEETLVNAVLHRDYTIHEPVTVVFEPDKVTITSLPGPDEYITDNDIACGKMISKRYRNKRIANYLKELHLAEARNTGIPKVKKALEANGSEPARYITDKKRTFLTVEIHVHADFLVESVTPDNSDMKTKILSILNSEGCMNMKDMSERLGYSGISKKIRLTIAEMIEQGEVTYLYPDKPRSPKQRICPVKHKR